MFGDILTGLIHDMMGILFWKFPCKIHKNWIFRGPPNIHKKYNSGHLSFSIILSFQKYFAPPLSLSVKDRNVYNMSSYLYTIYSLMCDYTVLINSCIQCGVTDLIVDEMTDIVISLQFTSILCRQQNIIIFICHVDKTIIAMFWITLAELV